MNFGKRKKKSNFNPDRLECKEAYDAYLKRGGKITRVELNYNLLMAGRNEVTADDFLFGV